MITVFVKIAGFFKPEINFSVEFRIDFHCERTSISSSPVTQRQGSHVLTSEQNKILWANGTSLSATPLACHLPSTSVRFHGSVVNFSDNPLLRHSAQKIQLFFSYRA